MRPKSKRRVGMGCAARVLQYTQSESMPKDGDNDNDNDNDDDDDDDGDDKCYVI